MNDYFSILPKEIKGEVLLYLELDSEDISNLETIYPEIKEILSLNFFRSEYLKIRHLSEYVPYLDYITDKLTKRRGRTADFEDIYLYILEIYDEVEKFFDSNKHLSVKYSFSNFYHYIRKEADISQIITGYDMKYFETLSDTSDTVFDTADEFYNNVNIIVIRYDQKYGYTFGVTIGGRLFVSPNDRNLISKKDIRNFLIKIILIGNDLNDYTFFSF